MIRRRSAAGVVLISLVILSGCKNYRGAPFQEPLAIDDPYVKLGQLVYFKHCHQCHPDGGRGIGPGIVNKPLPDWVIRTQVRQGIGQMPAFSDAEINDAELDGVVAYLNALRDHFRSADSRGD